MPSDPFIPLSEPWLAGNEAAYLADCVATNWVSSAGPYVDRFEGMVAGAVGAAHAVATASGTAALHTALMVAGVGPGDLVLTSTLTFIASANAIAYTGAEPVLVDADPATWQMDPARVAAYLAEDCAPGPDGPVEKASGRRVAAVMPVHILGHPVDMDPILAAARAHRLVVVEDATESLGARYKGRAAGTLGDLAAFSFNGNKLVTCGGGGMVVTGDGALAARARHLTTQAKSDPVESEHDALGYNYRLTNIQAAVGCAQMERLDTMVAARRRIAAAYRDAFAGVAGLAFMPAADWAEPVFWLSTVRIDREIFGADRRAVLARLAEKGIQARPLWQPLHRGAVHGGARCLGGAVAEALQDQALSLPSSGSLTDADQARVVAAVLACRA
ncbi:MAG: LegC family aminotransferase [Hyphomicrobiales bacterium]|nr:LegC family aminotransferase [Hyphomicrobiales bacterium]